MSLKATQIENGRVMHGEVVISGTAIALDIWWNLHARFFQRPNGEWKIGRYTDERGYSVRYKFCITRRFGGPAYPTEPQRLRVYKLMEAKYERMTIDQILASDVTILDYAVTGQFDRPAPREIRRSKPMTNETKQVEVVRTQCTAVPTATAKATGRCPRFMTKANEFGICGTHENFYKRGATIKLIDGRILNKKPAPVKATEVQATEILAPAAEPQKEGSGVDQIHPAPKKISTKERVKQALDTIRRKDAKRAEIIPVNDEPLQP